MSHLDRFFPYVQMNNNPIFHVDSKYLPDEATLRRRSLRWIGGMFLVTFVLWSAFALVILRNPETTRATFETISTMLVWGVFLSFFDKPVLDFVGVSAALTSVGREINTGRMDLLRLTHLRLGTFLEGKHAIAQINAWRVMTFVMGFRLVVTVFLFLHEVVLYELLYLAEPAWMTSAFDFRAPTHYLSLLASVPGVVTLITVYVLEPRWRLRALTASSLAVSAQNRDISLSLLSVALVIVRITMAQVFIAIAAIVLLSVVGWGTSLFNGTEQSIVVSGVAFVVYGALLGGLIRTSYHDMAKRSLSRAGMRLLRLDRL